MMLQTNDEEPRAHGGRLDLLRAVKLGKDPSVTKAKRRLTQTQRNRQQIYITRNVKRRFSGRRTWHQTEIWIFTNECSTSAVVTIQGFWYCQGNTHRPWEQDRELRHKPAHIQATDSWPTSQGCTTGNESPFRKVLGKRQPYAGEGN